MAKYNPAHVQGFGSRHKEKRFGMVGRYPHHSLRVMMCVPVKYYVSRFNGLPLVLFWLFFWLHIPTERGVAWWPKSLG